jgi:hypothetical protein
MVEQPLFGLKSRVTHEECAQYSVLHENHQQIFIDIIRAVGKLWAAGREKRDRHLVIDPTLMASRHDNRHSMRSCFGKSVVIGVPAIALATIRDPSDGHHV